MILILFFLSNILFNKIDLVNGQSDDECLYAIQRQKECFKIPMNDKNESCCFLEMELNSIVSTSCIRIKDDNSEKESRIFRIKENEKNYKLENLKISCESNFYLFTFLNIIIKILPYL